MAIFFLFIIYCHKFSYMALEYYIISHHLLKYIFRAYKALVYTFTVHVVPLAVIIRHWH